MAQTEISVEVRHELDKLVAQAVSAITSAVGTSARELADTHIPTEAPQGATGALSSPWETVERDPLTHVVHPGDDAWYAHIVARGRAESRPQAARALTVNGAFRMHAGGTAGDEFDNRAVAALEGRTDELIAAALADEGL